MVRWGHLHEIDYRTKVGSSAWRTSHPRRIQKLSAWRYLHALRSGHPAVRKQARKLGRKPSSNMSLNQMIKTARKWEAL